MRRLVLNRVSNLLSGGRRAFLKGTMSMGVAGTLSTGGLAISPRLHAQSATGLGVPWAYWDFSDAARSGDNSITSVSDSRSILPGEQGVLPSLRYRGISGVGAAWSTRPGWFVFPGATSYSGAGSYFRELMAAVPEYRPALELAGNLVLVAAQVNLSRTTGTAQQILAVGRMVGNSPGWALEYAAPNFRIMLRDYNGNQTINGPRFTAAGVDTVVCAVIDNRPEIKSCWICNLNDEGHVQFHRATTITRVGTVPWDPTVSSFQQISIGGRLSWAGGDLNYLSGALRRVLVVNYGTTPPKDLNGRIVSLLEGGGIPGAYING